MCLKYISVFFFDMSCASLVVKQNGRLKRIFQAPSVDSKIRIICTVLGRCKL